MDVQDSKRVAVIGNLNFTGYHVARRFLEAGDVVLAVETPGRSTHPELLESQNPNLTIVRAGQVHVGHSEQMGNLIGDFEPDAIVYNGNFYFGGDDTMIRAVNLIGPINAVNAAPDARFVLTTGSALVYGLVPPDQPVTPDRPLTYTGSAFADCETNVNAFLNAGDSNIVLCTTNLVGEGCDLGAPAAFMRSLADTELPRVTEETRRHVTYAGDLAEVAFRAAHGEGGKGRYFVVPPEDISMKDLFVATAGVMGRPVTYAPIEPNSANAAQIRLDNAKTMQDFPGLAWTPLATALQRQWADFQAHRPGPAVVSLNYKQDWGLPNLKS